jgi:hypothetical protein
MSTVRGKIADVQPGLRRRHRTRGATPQARGSKGLPPSRWSISAASRSISSSPVPRQMDSPVPRQMEKIVGSGWLLYPSAGSKSNEASPKKGPDALTGLHRNHVGQIERAEPNPTLGSVGSERTT